MIALSVLAILLSLAAATGWAMHYRERELRQIERMYSVFGTAEETGPVVVEDQGAHAEERDRMSVRSKEISRIESQLEKEAKRDGKNVSDEELAEEAERIYERLYGDGMGGF